MWVIILLVYAYDGDKPIPSRLFRKETGHIIIIKGRLKILAG